MRFLLHRNGCRRAKVQFERRERDVRAAPWRQRLRWLLSSEKGTAATEYAVLVALIAIGVLIAMGGFGDSLNGLYLAIAAVADAVA
jgi:Flp pilus assembly pilin Flp